MTNIMRGGWWCSFFFFQSRVIRVHIKGTYVSSRSYHIIIIPHKPRILCASRIVSSISSSFLLMIESVSLFKWITCQIWAQISIFTTEAIFFIHMRLFMSSLKFKHDSLNADKMKTQIIHFMCASLNFVALFCSEFSRQKNLSSKKCRIPKLNFLRVFTQIFVSQTATCPV